MRILRQRVKVLGTYRRSRQNIEDDKTGDDKFSRDDMRPVPSAAFARVIHKLFDLTCGSGKDNLACPIDSVGLQFVIGRGGQIRTADLLVPNQAPCRWATPRSMGEKWLTDGCGKPKS